MHHLKFILITLIICISTSLISAQQYSFVSEVDMYVGDEKQGSTQKMKYTISGQSTAIQIFRDGEAMITNIMDIEASKMTMVTSVGGIRSGMSMELPDRSGHGTQRDVPTDVSALVRTGETKDIDGHICHLYTKDTDDQFVEVWIDEKLDLDIIERMSSLEMSSPVGAQKDAPPKIKYPKVKGFPMLTYLEQKGSKSEGFMTRMSEVKTTGVDLTVFNLEGLKIVDMSKPKDEVEKN